MAKESLNPLESAQKQVKAACDALGLEPAVYEILSEPQRMIEISIPVKWMMELQRYLKVIEQFTTTQLDLVKEE